MTYPLDPRRLDRRGFLQTLFAAPVAYLLAACGLAPTPAAAPTVESATAIPQPTQPSPTEPAAAPVEAAASAPAPTEAAVQALAPTPACGDDDDVTPAQTEGPYYTPDTPERTSLLEAGITGAKLVVTGFVLTTDCRPVAAALIDFWHCDGDGVYDNVGYKLRGHQFTTEAGAYTLETIMPGLYPGRTRHIHVKVQAPNQPVLTTQLYFPGEPANQTDGIYAPELEMTLQETADGKAGAFNFVLALG